MYIHNFHLPAISDVCVYIYRPFFAKRASTDLLRDVVARTDGVWNNISGRKAREFVTSSFVWGEIEKNLYEITSAETTIRFQINNNPANLYTR